MIETLFYIMLTEAVLGGGGRLFAFGPLTLRMLLFGGCILTWLLVALTSTERRDGQMPAFLLVVFFLLSLMPGLTVDAAAGTDIAKIAGELQPLLFWFMAPFIATSLQDSRSVENASKIILYGGVAVAVVTTVIMAALQLGVIGLGLIYGWSVESKELFFRSSSLFFYKGHFFVGIAIIFCIMLRPPWWRAMCVVLLLSLALSLTRGLYLAVLVAVSLSLITSRRSMIVFIAAVLCIAAGVLYGNMFVDVIFDPSRNNSTEVRSRDFIYFSITFDYMTLLFGDGAGTLLNGRQGIENSFLWALWRFGIVGIVFWLSPFFISLRYFKRLKFGDRWYPLASAFFYGVVMLYIVTLFNPFVNNSIGLIYVNCAIFALRRLGRIEESLRRGESYPA